MNWAFRPGRKQRNWGLRNTPEMIEVEFAGPLAGLTGGESRIVLTGVSTVEEAVKALSEKYPRLKEYFLKEGSVSRRIIVYVDGNDIRFLDGELTKISSGSKMKIVTALVGG